MAKERKRILYRQIRTSVYLSIYQALYRCRWIGGGEAMLQFVSPASLLHRGNFFSVSSSSPLFQPIPLFIRVSKYHFCSCGSHDTGPYAARYIWFFTHFNTAKQCSSRIYISMPIQLLKGSISTEMLQEVLLPLPHCLPFFFLPLFFVKGLSYYFRFFSALALRFSAGQRGRGAACELRQLISLPRSLSYFSLSI